MANFQVSSKCAILSQNVILLTYLVMLPKWHLGCHYGTPNTFFFCDITIPVIPPSLFTQFRPLEVPVLQNIAIFNKLWFVTKTFRKEQTPEGSILFSVFNSESKMPSLMIYDQSIGYTRISDSLVKFKPVWGSLSNSMYAFIDNEGRHAKWWYRFF